MEKSVKTERTRLKRKLTRLGTKINLFIGDGDREGLEGHIDSMKSTMKDLEDLHVKSLEALTEDPDIEDAETYFCSLSLKVKTTNI